MHEAGNPCGAGGVANLWRMHATHDLALSVAVTKKSSLPPAPCMNQASAYDTGEVVATLRTLLLPGQRGRQRQGKATLPEKRSAAGGPPGSSA